MIDFNRKQLQYTQGLEGKEFYSMEEYKTVRNDIIQILQNNAQTEKVFKHMLACEQVMGDLFNVLSLNGISFDETQAEWMMAGLIHDADDHITQGPDHGLQAAKLVQEKGIQLTEAIIQSIAAHNAKGNVQPSAPMDWALYCTDAVTNLIILTVEENQYKLIENINIHQIMTNLENLEFAPKLQRQKLYACEEQLGLEIREFISIALMSMRKIAAKLGYNHRIEKPTF